ncbi:hypothetical protein TSMEX_006354 [Taenia solium]|eukprot:TsM_000836800 transcript=TsM_000836800 gene=TsM_000836800
MRSESRHRLYDERAKSPMYGWDRRGAIEVLWSTKMASGCTRDKTVDDMTTGASPSSMALSSKSRPDAKKSRDGKDYLARDDMANL